MKHNRDFVSMSEFPNLAVKYNVQSFPKIIMNETHKITGLPPEGDFVKEILKAAGK